jgi:hypothetical protein
VNKTKPFNISKHVVWESYRHVKSNQGAAGLDGQSIKNLEVNIIRITCIRNEIGCPQGVIFRQHLYGGNRIGGMTGKEYEPVKQVPVNIIGQLRRLQQEHGTKEIGKGNDEPAGPARLHGPARIKNNRQQYCNDSAQAHTVRDAPAKIGKPCQHSI